MGSTEWAEQHEAELANAVAYFNMDVAVSGPKFGASAVPSLKQFLRDVTKAVPSPKGGTRLRSVAEGRAAGTLLDAVSHRGDRRRAAHPAAQAKAMCRRRPGQRLRLHRISAALGVPSTDMGSSGPYGVYHSVVRQLRLVQEVRRPDFVYEQQMARVFGLEAIRMADADVLPYDYEEYGKEIESYLDAARAAIRRQIRQGLARFQRESTTPLNISSRLERRFWPSKRTLRKMSHV